MRQKGAPITPNEVANSKKPGFLFYNILAFFERMKLESRSLSQCGHKMNILYVIDNENLENDTIQDSSTNADRIESCTHPGPPLKREGVSTVLGWTVWVHSK